MRTLGYVALCGLLLVVAGTAGATTVYTLTDQNSSATVNPYSGMTSWTVDGQSQLCAQNFYYSVNSAAVANLASLPLTVANPATASELQLTYAGSGLNAFVRYDLSGSAVGSRQSDIGEFLRITNTSGQAVNLRFYQYVNLDLGGTPSDDTVSITNGRVADQADTTFTSSETVVTPAPSLYQAGNAATVLTSVLGGTLNNAAGPYFGDAAWAFEWNVTLQAGQALTISKDKAINPVPEPLTVMGLLASLSGVGAYIRNRKGI